MAIFNLKTTLEYADALCEHKRLFDMRDKAKGIKVGDIIRYTPFYNKKEVKGHAVSSKRFGVIYTDYDDPRVHKDLCIFQLVEIEQEFE